MFLLIFNLEIYKATVQEEEKSQEAKGREQK